ncbi:MAG: hypothetical protein ABEK00_01860 [Candidatus Nanohaloarchaea archaeon]
MAEIVDQYLEQEDWREVAKDSLEESDTRTLVAENLGTCMGIAAYDPKTGRGYLLHASTLENPDLDAQVEKFTGKLEEIERPFEVLAGGTMPASFDPLAEEDYTREARDTAENVLDNRGIDYEAAWNQRPVYNRLAVSPRYGILYDIWE